MVEGEKYDPDFQVYNPQHLEEGFAKGIFSLDFIDDVSLTVESMESARFLIDKVFDSEYKIQQYFYNS